jgi:hypothetical protein
MNEQGVVLWLRHLDLVTLLITPPYLIMLSNWAHVRKLKNQEGSKIVLLRPDKNTIVTVFSLD